VAVGGERSPTDQISGFLDALYWHGLTHGGAATLRFVLGRGADTDHVLQAIATLRAALAEPAQIEIELAPPGPAVCSRTSAAASRCSR
jgi:hypothetical protein